MTEELWRDAVPYLGCAFETSEILITTKGIELRLACEIFADSAILLAKIFIELEDFDKAQDILYMTIDRLEGELFLWPEHGVFINQHLKNLYKQTENLVLPTCFDKCLAIVN